MNLKLGKLPARANAIKLKFANYVDLAALPSVPKDFGHEEWSPPINWGMLGNDVYGDCVVAGAAHETILWNKIAGRDIHISTKDVLDDFEAITGQPPSATVGADMQQAASYRRRVGIRDKANNRHKVAAYLEIAPGNLPELYAAMYLFGAVGVGVEFPTSAFDQFRNHQSWHPVSGATIEAGHYIPAVALRSNIVVVTWGRFQAMRPSFYTTYNDESVAYVSEEFLTGGRSPEGFDAATLLRDLQSITA